ncbi:GNAT family N-acetyltransferase [Pannonibacter phragmitetus]|uniref:GNAT family N-acetyltransferase n=1 Tax=Pannonibacter phragmitetus TaxID=121719 RepID=UPI003D2EE349
MTMMVRELPDGWSCRWFCFDELPLAVLYEVLRLRVDVFVVEQNCPYPEIDGRDPEALHYLLTDAEGRLAAYLRAFAPSAEEPFVRLGRIVVAPHARGLRLGDHLMTAGLAWAASEHRHVPVELSAQAHLQRFYGSHGFEPAGEIYLEDGIPHVDMRRPAAATA